MVTNAFCVMGIVVQQRGPDGRLHSSVLKKRLRMKLGVGGDLS